MFSRECIFLLLSVGYLIKIASICSLKIRNISPQDSQNIKIITDGSASPKEKTGAWAACIVTSAEKIFLKGKENRVSQHAMELKAVISSLQYVQSTFQNASSIELYTDSEYVLNLPKRKGKFVANHYRTSKGKDVKHKELILQFYEYLESTPVNLMKVEGHAKKGMSEITDYHREVDRLSRKLVRQERDQ